MAAQIQPARRRMNKLLPNDRVHWLGATLFAAVLAEICRRYFALAAVGIAGAVLFVFVMSELAKTSLVARIGKRQVRHTRRSKLTRRIDFYAKQIGARRQQRPWLVVSLMSVALACALILHNVTLWHFLERSPQTADYAYLFSVVSISLLTMMIAGVVAEDDPPVDGKERVLKYLARYTPRDPAKRRELLRTIEEGNWTLSDVIAFAASEDEQRRIEETKAPERQALSR